MDTVGQVAINLVSPDSGFVGTQVEIIGKGFSNVPNENAIAFNGVSAPVLAASTTSLTTQVPLGATTGPITVKTPFGSATSPQPFTVLVATINVSPAQATLVRGTTQQFIATITGPSDTRVVWSVDDIVGGNATVGMITPDGLYTAPPPSTTATASLTVTVRAASLSVPGLSATASVTALATCTIFWTGAGGNNLWQNTANWSTKALPGVNDDACIGFGFNVTLSSGTQTIRSLNSDSALSISAGILSLATASTLNNNFTLNGGTLSGAGSFTVFGLTTWTSGTMTGAGTTTLNGNLSISGNAFHDLTAGRVLNTTATTTMLGAAGNDFLRMGGGAAINNSGLWLDQLTVTAGINVLGGAPPSFLNTGTIRKSGGSAVTTIGVAFNNTSGGAGTGVVEVLSGTLNFHGGGTANNGSIFTGAAGTALGFAGNHSLQVGSSVNGSTVALSNGTININGTYSATVATSVTTFGTANFNPGATVTNVGALSIGSGSGGTANFNTGGPINPTALTLPSIGTLAGTDTVTISGQTTWNGGVMRGTGITTLNGNVTITGNSFHDLSNGRTLNTTGTTTISGGSNEFLRTGAGATINNSGVWQDQSAFNYGIANVFGGAQSTFNNTGVYRKSNGGGATTIGILFNNTSGGPGSGVVEVLSGAVHFTGGGTANNGSIFTGAAGTALGFAGNHSLQVGSSVNGSTVALSNGTININGTYSATVATSVTTFGTANFNPGATVTNVGALSIGSGSGGTANFNTGGPINPTALTLPSIGTLAGTDTVTISGQTTWNGGVMRGTGITTLNGNATIGGNSFHDLFDGRTLNTNATTTMIGSFFRTSNGARINNSGTWIDQSTVNNTIEHIGGAQGAFNNSGTYRRNGSATTTMSIPFTNTSTVELQSGTARFTGGYTQTAGDTTLSGGALSSSTTINIQGGRLAGSGSVTANVSNAALVGPGASPGVLNISGNYTQTAAGRSISRSAG